MKALNNQVLSSKEWVDLWLKDMLFRNGTTKEEFLEDNKTKNRDNSVLILAPDKSIFRNKEIQEMSDYLKTLLPGVEFLVIPTVYPITQVPKTVLSKYADKIIEVVDK